MRQFRPTAVFAKRGGRQFLPAILRSHRPTLRLAVMVILLVAALSRANLRSFADDLAGADLRILAASSVLAYLAWLVNSYKWQRLLLASGIGRGLGELFRLNLVTIFIGLALPGQLSAEVLKALRLGSRVEQRGAAYWSVWLDRLTGLVGLVVVGLVGLVVGPQPPLEVVGKLAISVAFLGVMGLCLGLLFFPTSGGFLRLVARSKRGPTWLARLGDRVQRFIATGLDHSSPSIWIAITLGCGFQALSTASIWMSAMALGLAVSPLALAWITSIFALLQLLPISVGGLGVRDFTFVSLLGLYGVEGHQALALSLVAFGHLLLLGASGWILDLGSCRRVFSFLGRRDRSTKTRGLS